jgi:hypothetical protein
MRRRISLQQNLINHVGFVLDASASMRGKEKELIAVTDDLISFLKEKSQKYNQETRATIYIFGKDSQPACYDIDVLRTPSIASLYEATGDSTALVDATLLAVNEMRQTATLHGDHAFLLYVITDGHENSSRHRDTELHNALSSLPIEWTAAVLVPDRTSQSAAIRCGFDIENTMIWDATSAAGVVEVGEKIREATDNYFQARQQGVRGTKGIFTLDAQNLTKKAVSSTLDVVPKDKYWEFHVGRKDEVIKDAVESRRHGRYVIGSTFYQLTKTVEIQANKSIAIRDRNNGNVFVGEKARQLLGLPNTTAKVYPIHHIDYDIFVQSTAPNRKLLANTLAIVFT